MTTGNKKDITYRFLRSSSLAALATISHDGYPHVATINYLVDKKLCIYFVTPVESRKYKNILSSPNVAMAITSDASELKQTVQLSGLAQRIDNLEKEQRAIEELWRKNDSSKTGLPILTMFNRGASDELALIKVTPTEMTFGSFGGESENQNLFVKVIDH